MNKRINSGRINSLLNKKKQLYSSIMSNINPLVNNYISLNKHAFITYCNYKPPYKLNATDDDARLMIKSILPMFGINQHTLLSNFSADEYKNTLISLLSNTSIEFLLIYNSGHGYLYKNNCSIISNDYIPIFDYDLHTLINTYSSPNKKIVFISDSCNSGSLLDIKYNITPNKTVVEGYQDIKTCNIIYLSSCSDIQVSYESSKNGNYTNALFELLQSIKHNTFITYQDFNIIMEKIIIKSGPYQDIQTVSNIYKSPHNILIARNNNGNYGFIFQ